MTTTRLAFGSILGTVQSAATTVTGTLDTMSTAVGMATAFVNQAADNQRIRQIADKEDFLETLIMEKAEQRATAHLKADQFCAKSEQHSAHYNSAYNRYTSLLRKDQQDSSES